MVSVFPMIKSVIQIHFKFRGKHLVLPCAGFLPFLEIFFYKLQFFYPLMPLLLTSVLKFGLIFNDAKMQRCFYAFRHLSNVDKW